MKAMCGVVLLACVPLASAKNENAYPTEKVGEFVVAKLDVTSMPAAIRPKKEKGKKTFGDYGYVTQKVGEKEVLVEAPQDHAQITISVLEQSKSGIFVCLNGQAPKDSAGHIQRVLVLKLKNGDGLLKGRETWREFSGCPVIGGASETGGDSY